MKKVADYLMKFFIILTIGLGLLTLFKPEFIKNFIEWIKVTIDGLGYWNYLIIFISSLAESLPVIGIVVPGQNILMLVGGFFAKISHENFIIVMIIASLGAIISNFIGYYLGRIYGKIFFKEYGLWFGIGETEVKYMEKSIDKWGILGVTLGKFHNLARAFIPFIAGTSQMKPKAFWIYNTIGSIIRAITIVILGVFFVEYYEVIIDYFGYIITGIMILIGLYIWKYKKKDFKKYMQEKNEEMDRKFESK